MFGYKKLYIDGKLCDADDGKKLEVICPADDSVIAEVAQAGVSDTERALKAAERAFRPWRDTPIEKRVEYMRRLRDLIIENEDILREAEMFEHGKTYEQAEEGFVSVRNSLEYYARTIESLDGHLMADAVGNYEHKVVHQGAGVVGAFVAWNFPMLNLAFKLGPAMAAGCPLVLRPSEQTPVTAYIIGELCAQAELPAGVVNILTGHIGDTADVITKSTIPAVLTLIGSTATGRKIMENGASSIKRYSMELGGNAPALIFKDADLELASTLMTILKTANSGQICVTPNRIYVHEDVHDEFLEKVLAKVAAVKLGHGKGSGAEMGPLINKSARERIDSWVKESVAAGATLVYGGKIPEGMEDKGAYYMPTVLDNVPDNARCSCDEVFGSVICISTFKDYDEVIERANNTDMGLASYVFSNDVKTIQKASAELEFGEVQVNGVKYNIDLPHVGIKQSGIGQDCSRFALEDYMVKRRISTAIL